jgi:hypothetical protein
MVPGELHALVGQSRKRLLDAAPRHFHVELDLLGAREHRWAGDLNGDRASAPKHPIAPVTQLEGSASDRNRFSKRLGFAIYY